VLPHQLVTLDLVAGVGVFIQTPGLVPRANMQPAPAADEAVAVAAAVEIFQLPRLGHTLNAGTCRHELCKHFRHNVQAVRQYRQYRQYRQTYIMGAPQTQTGTSNEGHAGSNP